MSTLTISNVSILVFVVQRWPVACHDSFMRRPAQGATTLAKDGILLSELNAFLSFSLEVCPLEHGGYVANKASTTDRLHRDDSLGFRF